MSLFNLVFRENERILYTFELDIYIYLDQRKNSIGDMIVSAQVSPTNSRQDLHNSEPTQNKITQTGIWILPHFA